MSELKPCPFCGDENVEVLNRLEEEPEMELVGLTRDNWNVVCSYCYACGGTRRTATDAIDAWNKRVDFSKDFDHQKDDISKDGVKKEDDHK